MAEMKIDIEFWLKALHGRGHLGDTGVDWMILK
jgi:hypothetical protein